MNKSFATITLLLSLLTSRFFLPCGFGMGCCWGPPRTLAQDLAEARLVLVGTLAGKRAGDGSGSWHATQVHIEKVLKSDPWFGNRKVADVSAPISFYPDKNRFIIFCDVSGHQLVPWRGVPIANTGAVEQYVTGILALSPRAATDRLHFYFRHLDHLNDIISADAYLEFTNLDSASLGEFSRQLAPDKLTAWLQTPKTPPHRYELYATMLVHCGTARHGDLLRTMLSDPAKRFKTHVAGFLAAYTMLQPRQGWAYLQELLKKHNGEFLIRYGALGAVRLLWNCPPKIVSTTQLAQAVSLLLDQNDIADIAIEDLRKWSRWEYCDRVLSLVGRKSHDCPIIQRAILRYALRCPRRGAVEYVKQCRSLDEKMVKDIEELLNLEEHTTNVNLAFKRPLAFKRAS